MRGQSTGFKARQLIDGEMRGSSDPRPSRFTQLAKRTTHACCEIGYLAAASCRRKLFEGHP